jgi:hypothetical protein
MPLSPLLTTGHFDPPPGNATAVIKVLQNSQVTAWGWTEVTTTQNLRQEYWVLGPSYIQPTSAQTTFTFDSSGFPGGTPTTRSQFFAQLQGAWGGQPNVQTCAGPATAMAALPQTDQVGMAFSHEPVAAMKVGGAPAHPQAAHPQAAHPQPVHPSTPHSPAPGALGMHGSSLQVFGGTTEIWNGANNTLVGWLYTDPATRIESLVSATNMVGPGLPLILKPSQVQYSSPSQYFIAMTGFLQNHGPPQRYESIANTWYPGVYPL